MALFPKTRSSANVIQSVTVVAIYSAPRPALAILRTAPRISHTPHRVMVLDQDLRNEIVQLIRTVLGAAGQIPAAVDPVPAAVVPVSDDVPAADDTVLDDVTAAVVSVPASVDPVSAADDTVPAADDPVPDDMTTTVDPVPAPIPLASEQLELLQALDNMIALQEITNLSAILKYIIYILKKQLGHPIVGRAPHYPFRKDDKDDGAGGSSLGSSPVLRKRKSIG